MNNNTHNASGHCPSCFSEIKNEHFITPNLYICSCGWSFSSENMLANQRNTKSVVLSLAFLAIFFVGSFVHGVKWDSHFLSIIPLKVKQVSGMASGNDYLKIIAICKDRLNHSCVEEAYYDLHAKDSSNIEVLAQLAIYQNSLNKAKEANTNFTKYFKAGGNDLDASYEYAKVLAKLKKYKKAGKYFRYVLKAKPKTFQSTVARNYVNMLLEAKQLRKARYNINKFRKLGDNTVYFMASELNDINKVLKKDSSNVSSL